MLYFVLFSNIVSFVIVSYSDKNLIHRECTQELCSVTYETG
nr:MAG TPA: Endothelial protein C receptor [Caudoviricetes sp.]